MLAQPEPIYSNELLERIDSKIKRAVICQGFAVKGASSDQILNQAISAKLSTKYTEFSYS